MLAFSAFFCSHGYFFFHFHGWNIGGFPPASISNRGFGLYNTFCQRHKPAIQCAGLSCRRLALLARRALVDAACILYGGRHSAGSISWRVAAGWLACRSAALHALCGHRSGLYWHQAVFQQGKERQSRQWQLPDTFLFLEKLCFFLGRK